jgi:hypothetical protein
LCEAFFSRTTPFALSPIVTSCRLIPAIALYQQL